MASRPTARPAWPARARSSSWSRLRISRPRGLPGSISETMNSRIGRVASAETKNRLVMSSSSGLRSSTLTTLGSSAMPQIGQEPGSSRTISGCMGQVHSVRVGAAASTGSSAMPHFGQLPGPICRTSGSIGHVYSRAGSPVVRAARASASACTAARRLLRRRGRCGVLSGTPVGSPGTWPGTTARRSSRSPLRTRRSRRPSRARRACRTPDRSGAGPALHRPGRDGARRDRRAGATAPASA